jgi:hypothetical protein
MLPFICLTFSCIVTGWGYSFKKLLRCSFSEGLFNATSCLGILMFYSFFFAFSQGMALLILVLGGFFFILFATQIFLNKTTSWQHDILPLGCFFILCIVSLVVTYDLKFRSIDDFSFWGTISKYLFLFHQFPTNADYIHPSFLSYIPGMASFHYLLYSLSNHYSQALGYFAQGILLTSAMMVFFDSQNIQRSIVILSLWFVLFTLSYGTIFARMEVDAYVAAFLLGITWLIYQKKQSARLVVLPIIFLSIIKEIALLFSFLSIALLFLQRKSTHKAWICLLLATIGILITKFIWQEHVAAHHFPSFSQDISLTSIRAAFNPFNGYFHQAQVLYLKAVFLSSFDYLLRVPYFLLYLLLGWLWFNRQKAQADQARVNQFMIAFAVFAIIYLCSLYCLEAIVFDVGHTNPQILGFHRYYDMLFLPWLGLLVFLALDMLPTHPFNTLKNPLSITIICVASILLVAGKIERERKFYQPFNLYSLKSLISANTAKWTQGTRHVCLLNPPKPHYELLMPLAYFFMPTRVISPQSAEEFRSCDLSLQWVANTPKVV